MLYRNISKVSVIVQNKSFGFCLLLLLLFRTGLDFKMDCAEKGGACERNPIGGEFDPICQRNLSSAATSAIGPKRGNEEVDANRQEIEGLVRTRRKVYPKTPEQLCETKEKKRDQQKTAYVRRKEKRVAFEGSLTPDQLCETQQKKRDQRKAAYVRSKEKRVAFEGSLTPDQLCETQQKRGINKKQSMLEERRKGLPSNCV